jgi:methionyl-tRNA synthetase
LEFYEKNPDFIVPHARFQEVKEFVKQGLEDFSISRETNTFGIPLPFDTSQITYVWFDALFNYVSYCQGEDVKFWPANLHIIGKDIIRFHGIYWPAMLMSVGLPPPRQLMSTGYLTVEGQKISKTIGNVIDPVEFTKKYSRDVLVLYMLLGYPIGQDGDWSTSEAINQYHAKLSNALGNLVSRTCNLARKRHAGKVFSQSAEVLASFAELIQSYDSIE